MASLNVMEKKMGSLKWAIVLSAFLALLKGGAGWRCSSVALLASCLDSLMDVGISSVNYLSVRKAAKPPDDDHAYGHQKIESLASYTQGMVILFFAFLVLMKVFSGTGSSEAVEHSGLALITVVIAGIVNLVLTFILQRAEKQTDSLILKAEMSHYLMDILSYVMIFIVLVLVRWTGWAGWDQVGGIALAVYVGYLAVRILLQAGNELVDRSLPKSALDEMDTIIRSHPGVTDYHELRTRKVGQKHFVDFHLVMEPDRSFEEVHEIAEGLIEKLKDRFRDADILVHEDPMGGK